MAVKYERVIERLRVDQVSNTTGAVVSVDWWHHSLDDDMCHGSIRRSIDLSPPDPKKFIDYANLTPEMVFSWIDASRTAEEKKQDLQELKDQMKVRPSPVDYPPLPWEPQTQSNTRPDMQVLNEKWDKKIGKKVAAVKKVPVRRSPNPTVTDNPGTE